MSAVPALLPSAGVATCGVSRSGRCGGGRLLQRCRDAGRPIADLLPIAQVSHLGRCISDHRLLDEPGGLRRQPAAEDNVIACSQLLRFPDYLRRLGPGRVGVLTERSRGEDPERPGRKLACVTVKQMASVPLPALHVHRAAEHHRVVVGEILDIAGRPAIGFEARRGAAPRRSPLRSPQSSRACWRRRRGRVSVSRSRWRSCGQPCTGEQRLHPANRANQWGELRLPLSATRSAAGCWSAFVGTVVSERKPAVNPVISRQRMTTLQVWIRSRQRRCF